MSKRKEPPVLPNNPEMTSMNVSVPDLVKKAIANIPKWQHPNASAYVTSVLVKDLVERGQLRLPEEN